MSTAQLVSQLFSQPKTLPLCSLETLIPEGRSDQPVLVVAPHPDDECLGCGGLIALLRTRGDAVQILVISDGTRSHPNSRKFPAPVLQRLREAETRAAMAELGLTAEAIRFLGLTDGAVPTGGAAFAEAVESAGQFLQTLRPRLVCLPWRFDPHPDHRASWNIVTTALDAVPDLQPRRLEYPIWDWDETQRGSISKPISVWRLDISPVVCQKQQAIQAYRSQITDLIDDDPEGFQLSTELLHQFSQPWEIYFEAQEVVNFETISEDIL